MKVAELKAVADELAIDNADKLKKQDLIYKILDVQALKAEPTESTAAPASETPPSEVAADTPAKGKRERARKPAPKAEEQTSTLFEQPEVSANASQEVPNETEQPQGNVQPQPEAQPNQNRPQQHGHREQRRFDQPRERGQQHHESQQPHNQQHQQQAHQQHQHQNQQQQHH
ncbi:MAG: Rho termination factor N-terminal domain-containing protein, partial [Flavobacteriales bacterium]